MVPEEKGGCTEKSGGGGLEGYGTASDPGDGGEFFASHQYSG